MSTDFILASEPREKIGTSASRRLRHNGKVPCILYGADEDPVALTIGHNELSKAVERGALSGIFKLEHSGKQQQVVLRDLQHHPFKTKFMHLDLQRINVLEKLRIAVPLHVVGEDACPGVQMEKGIVVTHVHEIEVECLPANLPEQIEVDVASLNVGDAIHLAELKVGEGVEIPALHGFEEKDEEEQTEVNQAIVSIQPPQAEILEVEEEEGEAAAEGEAEEGAEPFDEESND